MGHGEDMIRNITVYQTKEHVMARSQLLIVGRFNNKQERRFTMKQVLPVGLCLILLAACGCQSNEASNSPSLASCDIARDAQATYSAHGRAVRAGTETLTTEIPSTYWADRIKALNPIKVYTHRVNIVVVQRISDGTEEGKYIYIPISSYLPHTGDDGFEFSPNPQNGNTYTMGNGVFDFKRTKSN
jgi:hypothetical protein